AKHIAFVAGLGPTSTPRVVPETSAGCIGFEGFAEGVKKSSTPCAARCDRATRPSPHAESKHAAFVAGLGPTSTPWVARPQPPTKRPADVKDELLDTSREHRAQRSTHPPTLSATSLEAGSLPRPDVVESASEGRYAKFIARLNAMSTPRDVQERLKRRMQAVKGQRNGSGNGPAPRARTGSPSPQPEITSKPQSPASSCLTKSEDRYRAFALGVQAASTPASVTTPPIPPQLSGPSSPLPLPPLSPHPASVPMPAPPSPPTPPPVKTNEGTTQKPQMQTSESFFRPRPTKSPLSKPLKFVLKSRIPPLAEFIEGSSKDGLPLGRTPAVVRFRRESRYIPGSPETPCRESKARGSGSKVFSRLEGVLQGALGRGTGR
ncbi:hypothetical protein BDY19DRAFT_389260, partial [Irpex rosettiformis]